MCTHYAVFVGVDLHRLSIHTMTTRPWSLAEAAQACARAGVGGVSPWVEHVEPIGVGEAARIIADFGLRVPAYVRGGFFVHSDTHERARAIERTRRLIDDARALGAESLVIVAGSQPGVALDDGRAMTCDALGVLVDHAAAAGLRLAVEPLHPMYAGDRSCVNTIAQARAICDRVGSPVLGVAVDVYHVWWDDRLEAQIEALGREGRLFGFHVCDFKPEPAHPLHDRGLMGEGCAPIREIRAMVERAGFDGMIEVEVFNRKWWATDQRTFLRAIIEAAHAHA